MRKYPRTGRETFHHGPDISAPNGTPIKSIDDGKVILSGAQNPNNLAEGFGYRVTLETKYGTAVYGHMNGTPAVKEEDVVSAGDLLGNVGKSGGSTGNHLHYERRDKNNNSFPPTKNFYNESSSILFKDFSAFKRISSGIRISVSSSFKAR